VTPNEAGFDAEVVQGQGPDLIEGHPRRTSTHVGHEALQISRPYLFEKEKEQVFDARAPDI